jgi:two-component system, OmpR family, response regulator
MHEPAMRRKRIVIIDDEEDLCLLMKSYFDGLGYDVFLANTLDSGMHLLKEVSPDILFLDNNLPDGLGWDQTSYVADTYPNCKINLISAFKHTPPDLSRSSIQVIEKPLRLNLLKQYL